MNELNIVVEGAKLAFSQAVTPADLENAKALFLGKTGRITELMKGMASLAVEEKKPRGASINIAKQAIETALNQGAKRWQRPSFRSNCMPRHLTSLCLDGNEGLVDFILFH